MQPFKGYETARVLTETERLPAGGYIIGILEAKEVQTEWGNKLEVKFDIAEGEHRGFYTSQYKNSQMEDRKYKGNYRLNIPDEVGSERDGWAANAFKTAIAAIEESNPDYIWDWDESKLTGKKVGMVFRDKEYDYQGKTGFFTEPFRMHSADKIREGKFKLPNPKLLSDKPAQGFSAISESIDDEDLPF